MLGFSKHMISDDTLIGRVSCYVVCASTRPQFFKHLDFRDTSLINYNTLYGLTYGKGIGLFEDDRSGAPVDLTIEGFVNELVPYFESGIFTFFNCDESSTTRSKFTIILKSDTGDEIRIENNEWAGSIDVLARYNGSQKILFSTNGTSISVGWYLKDGVLSNDVNSQVFDTGGFNAISVYCYCKAENVGNDACMSLSVFGQVDQLSSTGLPAVD